MRQGCFVIHWKICLVLLVASLLAACSDAERPDLWSKYKQRFLQQDGSIVDISNGSIRHSEGQGTGLLLAVANNDKESFDLIWKWTQSNLQLQSDNKLFAWKWQPQSPHVSDLNNATDGDILIAWALLRASEKWNLPTYKQQALMILNDIERLLVYSYQGNLLLLPGQYGFKHEDGIVINLSYWIFPALRHFSKIQPNKPIWNDLIQSGQQLMEDGHFGPWNMPADWLMVGEHLMLRKNVPQHFGLDAVRIPLYLIWGGYSSHIAVKRVSHFWDSFTGVGAFPDWLSLEDTVVHMAGSAEGVIAIAHFAHAMTQNESTYTTLDINWQEIEYYQASLALLSALAWEDVHP
ncbi:MAG: glycosyl hydrolase family 5 [Zetaproteobacteria bacterium]|nr:glycosyl hydrolase family 5 [Zetaproteobacteria bacterium]